MKSEINEESETELEVIAALYLTQRAGTGAGISVGLACYHAQEFQIRLCGFKDTHEFVFLETGLLQCHPSKVYIQSDGTVAPQDVAASREIAKKCGAVAENVPSSPHRSGEVNKLFVPGDMLRLQASAGDALDRETQAALATLVDACRLLKDKALYGQLKLHPSPINAFVRLDQAAVEALRLLPTQPGETAKSSTNLLGLLNKCRTAFGLQKLWTWIAQPSLDIKEINSRHDVVQLLITAADLRNVLQSSFLKRLPNLQNLGYKMQRQAACSSENKSADRSNSGSAGLTLDNVVQLAQAYKDCGGLVACLEMIRDRLRPINPGPVASLESLILESLQKQLQRMKKLADLVAFAVDKADLDRGIVTINRNLDPELENAASSRDSLLEEMEKHRVKIEEKLGLANGKSEAVRVVDYLTNGKVFRVTKRDQKAVHKCSECKSVRLNKAEMLFTTSKLAHLAEKLIEAENRYDSLQSHLARKTVSAAASYWPVIRKLTESVAKIDVLASFAECASTSSIPFCRPKMFSASRHDMKTDGAVNGDTPAEDGLMGDNSQSKLTPAFINACPATDSGRRIRLVNCRHPLVERQLHMTQKNFIANSVNLRSPDRVLNVLTGANMGGKSTFIRQVAIAVLMAQIGCFVAAEEAEISMCDAVLCRVGASDDQQRGISTFLAEMVEASAILKAATEQSLVLVDELGRGTSTNEGCGLAWAIGKHLAEKIGCFCLFATHFQELTNLASHCRGVFNSRLAAAVTNGVLVLHYHVEPGSASASYGVQVAQLVGLHPSIIAKATKIADNLEKAATGGFDKAAAFLSTVKKLRNEKLSVEDFRSRLLAEFSANSLVENNNMEGSRLNIAAMTCS